MARYIDADKLIEALQEEFDFEPTLSTEEQDKWFKRGIKCAIRNVDRIPTADVEEVKHGEWIWLEGNLYECSECPNKTEVDEKMNQPLYKFCPYCGAKMDGGDAE